MRKYISGIIMTILAVLIAAGFFVNHMLATEWLPKERVYTASLDPSMPKEDVFVTLSVQKQWQEDRYHAGAEYDWTIYNHSGHDLENWVVTMQVPDKTVIDSIWNVEEELDESNKLTLYALDDVNKIFSKESRTFGMIIISLGAYNSITPTDIQISCDLQFKPTEMPLFYGLIIACVLWFIALLFLFSKYVMDKRLEMRKQRDKEVILQSMSVFVNFIDAKDPYTNGHSQRVAMYSSEIGRRMGLSDEVVDSLYYAALLHDAGKIGIPDNILKKNGKLNSEEYDVIKTHSTIGGDMLSGFTAIKEIPDVAMYHHEKYDGSGYPSGRKGEEIPLFARIVCVADSYDAMSSNRCYRRSLTDEVIRAEFARCTGTQFDPKIVPYIIEMMDDGTTERIAGSIAVERSAEA